MLIGVVGDDLYNTILMVHILAAIVGFGAVFLNGVYAAQIKKHGGSEGLAIAEANHAVTKIGEYVIWTVPVWGILLILTSDKVWKFSQMWVGAALGIYIVAVGVATGVLIPLTKKMREKMAELIAMGPPPEGAPASGPPPQVAELEAMGKRAAILGGSLNIAILAILFLMVFKPGA
ncbi:MAG: hypothetical protein QOG03_1374 [Actinomycetota bacterium]|jgi:hypothetical protein|nr:hypothetical protein [Actinomycetota bacterium]